MNDKAEHSPTQWGNELRHGFHPTVLDTNGETVAFNVSSQANANFIVRACNSYNALVAATEALLDALETYIEADELAQTQGYGAITNPRKAFRRQIKQARYALSLAERKVGR